MFSETKRLTILPWVPMGFCAALVLITVVTMIWMMATGGPNSGGGWALAFLCNLPLCFMFVGFMTAHLQREVRELRQQIAELQTKRAG